MKEEVEAVKHAQGEYAFKSQLVNLEEKLGFYATKGELSQLHNLMDRNATKIETDMICSELQ
jgi:hypothetical protein